MTAKKIHYLNVPAITLNVGMMLLFLQLIILAHTIPRAKLLRLLEGEHMMVYQ